MCTNVKYCHLLGRLRTFGDTGSMPLGAASALHESGQKSGSSVFAAFVPSHRQFMFMLVSFDF